mmetsp:Transcript_62682/g.125598  ORF Transcript_62682/g.125598 Transcript_62682/m.125598 type:complete len:231 (+) Transcript_62682:654-1346(+)
MLWRNRIAHLSAILLQPSLCFGRVVVSAALQTLIALVGRRQLNGPKDVKPAHPFPVLPPQIFLEPLHQLSRMLQCPRVEFGVHFVLALEPCHHLRRRRVVLSLVGPRVAEPHVCHAQRALQQQARALEAKLLHDQRNVKRREGRFRQLEVGCVKGLHAAPGGPEVTLPQVLSCAAVLPRIHYALLRQRAREVVGEVRVSAREGPPQAPARRGLKVHEGHALVQPLVPHLA